MSDEALAGLPRPDLSKQERALIETLRVNAREAVPDWAINIEHHYGVWDVYLRGMIGGARGTGPTFEAAWDAVVQADAEPRLEYQRSGGND
jgi:hypothetical protein